MQAFPDRFFAAVAQKGAPVCVGLDPAPGRLNNRSLADWSRDVLDAVAPYTPIVKFQLACYERDGTAGFAAYETAVKHAKSLGLLVLADAKRGDIGVTSSHYAAGVLTGEHAADAMTVNGYLGGDALQPFIDTAAEHHAGLFCLVRTSNPGSDDFQMLKLEDGRTISEAMADLVVKLGEETIGPSGYSLLGAVVGATKPKDAAALRQRMLNQLFLVPGYGAQGGGAADVRACFHDDGRGAIITASRSVIYAPDVALAAKQLRDEIAEVVRSA